MVPKRKIPGRLTYPNWQVPNWTIWFQVRPVQCPPKCDLSSILIINSWYKYIFCSSLDTTNSETMNTLESHMVCLLIWNFGKIQTQKKVTMPINILKQMLIQPLLSCTRLIFLWNLIAYFKSKEFEFSQNCLSN